MKAKLAGLALLLTAGTAWGQVANLSGADVTDRTSVTDPVKAANSLNNEWMAFTLPVLDDTSAPCCWKGDWRQFGEAGCHLESRQISYGSRSDAPSAESLVVFAKVNSGEVTSLLVVGNQCPVEGDGQKVDWLGSVDEKSGLDWLEAIARSEQVESDPVRHSALYAMSLSRSDDVTTRLAGMAREDHSDLQREAIFWLGEARGEAGLSQLTDLLSELPISKTRRELNFAIAQNGSTKARELLVNISRTDTDPGQRSGALFWLAQEFPREAKHILEDVLAEESDIEVLNEAVFAVSQLPEDVAGPMLLKLAGDSQASREVRRQALFWLAQSGDEQSIAALTELLSH